MREYVDLVSGTSSGRDVKKGFSLPPGYTGIVKDIEKGCTSGFEL